MSEILSKIFILCSKNKVDFSLQKEGEENYVKIIEEPRKKVIVNLPGEDLDEMENFLTNKLEELNQLFQ